MNRQWLVLTHKDAVQAPDIAMRKKNKSESRKQTGAEYV